MPISLHDRFILLDGLRGIAALFIVHRHAEDLFGKALPSSYLGVDLFFALSGFVLAHAYGARLRDQEISPAQFMKARLARIYPLYSLGLLLMAGYFLTLYGLGKPTPLDDLHRPVNLDELAIAVVTGLLFVPAPFTLSLNGALFLVSPAWSLFNELVSNIIYGIWGVRATPKQLLVLLLVSACVLVVAAIEFGRLHAGFRWHEMYAGMGRVFFSFFAGVLVYRFRDRVVTLEPRKAALYLLIAFAILAFPTPRSARPFFDLMIVLFVWPGLIFLASRTIPGPFVGAVSSFLGTASFAIYVLHIPLLAWAELLVPGMTREDTALVAGVVFVVLLTWFCWYLTTAVDQPLQKWLKRWLRTSRAKRQPGE